MKFKDFFSAAVKKLIIETIVRLNSSKREKAIKMIFEDEEIIVGATTRYFHFFARFLILFDTELDFQLNSPPIHSQNSKTNIKYSKIFAEMAKDNAPNKI